MKTGFAHHERVETCREQSSRLARQKPPPSQDEATTAPLVEWVVNRRNRRRFINIDDGPSRLFTETIDVTNEQPSPESGVGAANLTATADISAAAAHEVERRLQQIADRLRAGDGAALEGREQLPRTCHPQGAPRLGEMLVSRGLITPAEVDRGLEAQRSSGKRLGEALVEIGLITSVDLSHVLADRLGVPFIDLAAHPPELLVAGTISAEVARRYNAVPVERLGDQLVVAMAQPDDVFALDDLRVITGTRIVAALAEPEQLATTIDRMYQQSTLEATIDDAADERREEATPDEYLTEDEEGPVVRLVNALLDQAITDRASDLHIEPASHKVSIRLRIDGILHDASEAPLAILRPLVSRLKVLGGLDIAQSRVAQDGRFSLRAQGRDIDVRIASIPTSMGEAVVLRMLDPVRAVTKIADLGLDRDQESRLTSALRAPQGATILTGPTGSGKTSTLYAMASEINSRDRSIVSVEDPVEYRIDGLKQVQINERAGTTFPSALRSLLRADPDVMLIGEIRDAETARIAANAAITGHLVLSTLHATRAAAAPMRLVDMGVEPYLVASALTCLAAQRLFRRLCPKCAERVANPDLRSLARLGATDEMLSTASLRVPVGCPECFGTGYRGRGAIIEVMHVTEEIGRLIVERAPTTEIERTAVEQGMETLRSAALRRVASGELTFEEMMRVLTV
jgi:type IV pilus assembly protein PilB